MPHTPELEICAYSIEAAISAQRAGADRVELCAGFAEGGLTPSAGAIAMARRLDVECYVMIRPRGGDFCYSNSEFEQMHLDIEYARRCGVHGVVLGALQPGGHVNIVRTRELVQHAHPLGVTFHRAFDLAADPLQALDDIVVCGCRRILTSGQKATAEEGLELLRTLTTHAAGRIDIMAGSGVNPGNARALLNAGVQALHLSARRLKPGRMTWHNPSVQLMQTEAVADGSLVTADEELIRRMRDLIRGRHTAACR